MSLFNNAYSGLVTKGLGGRASQSLITMNLGVFSFTVEIDVPVRPPANVGGGGGGNIASRPQHINYLTPMNAHFPIATKHVMITIKVGDKKTTKHFAVSKLSASLIVKASRVTSKTVSGVKVVVEGFRVLYHRARNKYRSSEDNNNV